MVIGGYLSAMIPNFVAAATRGYTTTGAPPSGVIWHLQHYGATEISSCFWKAIVMFSEKSYHNLYKKLESRILRQLQVPLTLITAEEITEQVQFLCG